MANKFLIPSFLAVLPQDFHGVRAYCLIQISLLVGIMLVPEKNFLLKVNETIIGL